MAQDEGKQEEKFDFGREGEALGYISLDQARVLAIRTAREVHGEYGSQFADINMAFEVVQDTETEDHYLVTLSFRPQGQFSGKPGQEQFFIEKEGTVTIRQVLSLPTLERGRRFPLMRIAIGLVVLVIAAGAWIIFVGDRSGDGEGDDNPNAGLTTPTTAPTSTPELAVEAVSSLTPTPVATRPPSLTRTPTPIAPPT